MTVMDILGALQDTRLALAISSGTPWKNLFPAIETVHVLFITLTVGSILMVDLRLIGISSRDSVVSDLSREVLPWTWTAFAVAAVAGALLFISKAQSYFENPQFRFKFLFMFLAFVNMMVFHRGAYRRVLDWDRLLPPPTAARIAGVVSIALWMGVIVMGRWVGFTGFLE